MSKVSDAEREIRAALVEWIHENLPTARVIHELNVDTGARRIDVAAITSTEIYAFEIKSARDRVTRLRDQMRVFAECCHYAVAVLDERHWSKAPGGRHFVNWRWPSALAHESSYFGTYYSGRWARPEPTLRQPAPQRLLDLLWRAELVEACDAHAVGKGKRPTRQRMIDALAWALTGEQIARATCAALRGRDIDSRRAHLPPSDPPAVAAPELAEAA